MIGYLTNKLFINFLFYIIKLLLLIILYYYFIMDEKKVIDSIKYSYINYDNYYFNKLINYPYTKILNFYNYIKINIEEYNIDELNIQELENELNNYTILQTSSVYPYDDIMITQKIIYINNLINEKKNK